MSISIKLAFAFLMVQPLDESQGPSHLHGYGLWLVCEVALRVWWRHSKLENLVLSKVVCGFGCGCYSIVFSIDDLYSVGM